ncbi:unnamed protein product [Blepharisma stoltei]|uniref:RZ-type domain-containing protein n=1 Tax=Blepharisma stoltei TaxID=1481888 RepID=A0AAU9JJW6_9CILI|nr:unnamed protein product [Blepharisma stoltei]
MSAEEAKELAFCEKEEGKAEDLIPEESRSDENYKLRNIISPIAELTDQPCHPEKKIKSITEEQPKDKFSDCEDTSANICTIYALYKLTPQERENNSLQLAIIGSDSYPIKFQKFKILEGYCKKFDQNIKIFEMPIQLNKGWNGCIQVKLMFYDKSLDKIKENWESGGQCRGVNLEFQNNFLFDVNIVTIYSLGAVRPDGESVSGSFKQLSIYADYLLKNLNWEKTIPMLIKQFKAKYGFDITDYDNAKIFLEILEEFISSYPQLSIEKLHALVSLISCITHSMIPDVNFSKSQVLLENTDQFQNLESDPHFLKGLAHLMAFKMKEDRKIWNVFDYNMGDDSKFEILEHFLKDLDELKIPLNIEQKNFIISKINSFNLKRWICIFKKIVSQGLSCDEFFRSLQLVCLKETNELAKNKSIKDIDTLVEEYCEKYISSLDNIVEFFRVLCSLDQEFKLLMYNNKARAMIWNILKQSTEKIKIRLHCYEQIFKNYYDVFYSDYYSAIELSETLIYEDKIEFSIVCNTFNFKISVVDSFFEKWSNNIIANHQKVEDIISNFKSEALSIENQKNLERLCFIFVERLLLRCKNIKKEFLSCVVNIDNCQNEILNEAYIEIELKNEKELLLGKEISENDKVEKILKKFSKLHEKNEKNKTLSTLIERELSLIVYEYSEQYIKNALFTEPQKKKWWGWIFNSNKKLTSFKHPKLLISTISKIGEKIYNKDITLSEIDTIKNQLKQQRSDMINLLEISFNNLDKEKLNFSMAIEEAIEKKNEIENSLNSFNRFICHFQDIMVDYEAIEKEHKDLMKKFLEIKLAKFEFPQQIKMIVDISCEIGLAIDSYIFNNYYLPECKILLTTSSSPKLDIHKIIEGCRNSYDKMIQNLIKLFLDASANYPLGEFIKIFSKIQDVDKEIEIIASLMKNEGLFAFDKIARFREFLERYQENDTLLNACHGIIGLKEITGEADINVLKICSDYIKLSSNLYNYCIYEFLNESAKIHELFQNLSKEQKNSLAASLQEIAKSKELVLFLLSLREGEIKDMKEGINDYEIEFVSMQTILDLENLWYCIRDIKDSLSNFAQLSQLFASNCDNGKDFKSVPSQLCSCAAQLNAITKLHIEINCKEEAKKKQIFGIVKKSSFKLKFENNEYLIDLVYSENAKKQFDISDINELKNRAQLIMHTYQSSCTHNDGGLQYFDVFVNYINLINKIINCMNDLYQSGYPKLEDKLNEEFSCCDGDYEAVIQLKKEIQRLFKSWEKNLSNSYKECFWLTFLSGNQFWTLENYIIDSSCVSKNEAISLLKFMGKQTELSVQYIKDGLPEERLMKLGIVLNEIPNLNGIPPNPEILAFQGEIIILDTTKYLNGIFSIYEYYKLSFPSASQVLFCKSCTYWRELKSFLYRYFKDPSCNIYCLINCENLSLENQINFKLLFNELYGLSPIKSGLGIITANPKCYLLQYLIYLKVPKVNRFSSNKILSDEKIKIKISEIENQSRVITSSFAGLGKSVMIKEEERQKGSNLITFPIGGDINYAELCKMISKLNTVTGNSVLLLNISYTSNPSLLNEILINICLFRTLSTSESISVLDAGIPILIEVANSFQDNLLKSIDYLSFVPSCHLDYFDIERLIVPQIIDDPIQVVGNYLNLYENHLIDDKKAIENKIILQKDHLIYLIKNYFIEEQYDKKSVTYTQLNIFISILNWLLLNFERSPFSPDIIKDIQENLSYLGLSNIAEKLSYFRTMVFESLLSSTKEFTTKCISNIKEIQEKSSEKILMNQIDDANEISSLALKYQNNIKWESSNHFHLIFLKDGSFIPIYRNRDCVPENFKELISLQKLAAKQNIFIRKRKNKEQWKNFEIDDYASMNRYQLLEILNNYNRYNVRLEKTYGDGEYVMTPDNFLKMNLIYLRVYSGLPVIIMGETGCGKTSLIQFLVENVLGKPKKEPLRSSLHSSSSIEEETKDESSRLYSKISIHAGTTSEDIRNKMKKITEKAQKIGPDEKLWVFFDEFNTTDSIGMICEIMCERTLDGNPLPSNIAFLGACNPYRVSSKKGMQQNIGIKKVKRTQNESKLVHLVKPLPETMIDYVWDFGTLTHEDVRKYVNNMLDRINSQYKEVFTDMICIAHKYFQEEEDVSSVSLRDVSRFIDLYLWFEKSISDHLNLPPKSKVNEKYINANQDTDLSAGILSFSHCYYLRIASELDRERFIRKISDSISSPFISVLKIKEIIELEKNDYIERMELPKGTALNNALKENIFAAIPCIVNKIPVFICGKPGSSKSLSIELIFSNLRGKTSNDHYFRTLPELVMVHFQGSESCKSGGIIKVFEKAGKHPKIGHEVLPVIVFDEIGLAELSRYNPLKVLHKYLEKENIKVGFIGISNWRLDASKMNRALYLARPDPCEDDLVLTALDIYHSYTENKIYDHIIKKLAKAYTSLKTQTQETEIADFYGLRDFYHLIKRVSEKLIDKENSTSEFITNCVKAAIERNFGGTSYGESIMCSLFYDYHKINLPKKNTKIFELLNDNLNDPNARYLMIIGKPDIAMFILDKYLSDNKNRRIIVGSSLPDDINQDSYGFESLNDIIIYMELGVSIVLKDMDHIYSSLYDLFNQSFSIHGSENYQRKYCKISLGDNFNPKCLVHPNFHVITLISPEDVKKQDAPFLNRFEKHILTIEKILNNKQAKLLKELENWIDLFFVIKEQRVVSFTKNHLFPIYSSDSLALLILFNEKGEENSETLEKCKKNLLEIASSDILILLELISIDPEIKESIKNKWKELHAINFKDTIKSMIDNTSDFENIFAFTYDKRISEKIFNTDDDDEKLIIKEMIAYNSKQDLAKELNAFYRNETQKVFILEVDFGEECVHLPLVKFLIDKINSENPLSKKKFCIVIHIKRNIKYSSFTMLFESWKMKMFDSLLDNSFEVTDEILSKDTKSLILDYEIFNFQKEIKHLAERCLLSFRVEITEENKDKIPIYLNNAIEKIGTDCDIASHFKAKIWKNLQAKIINKDWKEEIFLKSKLIDDSANLYEAISLFLETEIESSLQLILYTLERNSALFSCIEPFRDPYLEFDSFRKQIWFDIFDTLGIDNNIGLNRLYQGNIIKCEYELCFPFSMMDYKTVVAAFKSYEISEMEENQIQTPIEQFKDEYNKHSKYNRGKLDFNGEHSKLQDLYFGDLVSIYLKENLLSLHHKEFICELLKIVFHGDNLFEKKLISFMKIGELGVLLCNTFDLLPELENKAIKILQKHLKDLPPYESEQDENSEENENTRKTVLDSIYEMLINEMISSNNEDVLQYSIKAEKLYNVLTEIELKEYAFIETLDILEFWVSYSKLVAKNNGKREDLSYLLDQALNVETETKNYVCSIEFARHVLPKVKEKYSESEQYLKFISSYFKLLASNDSIFIKDIAEEFKNEEFWKYTTKIMSIIVEKSKIIECIEDLKYKISNNKDVDFELPNDNNYLNEIEEALKQQGIHSKFGIILSDNLGNYFDSEKKDDAKSKSDIEKLKSDYQFFKYFLKKGKLEQIEYPKIKKIISLTLVRNYLDIYCCVLAKKILNDKEEEIKEKIDKTIFNLDIGDTLKMYCVKKILTITGYDISKFIIEYPNLKWIPRIKEIEQEKSKKINLDLDSFLVFPRVLEKYKRNVYIIKKILENENQNLYDEILIETQNPDQKLALGIAFLNKIFSIYSKEKEMNRNIINFFKCRKDDILNAFGQEFYQLFYFYIHNFPANSDLRLERDTSETDLHRILTILGIFTVILSYSQKLNPISSIFFNENGSLDNLSERFNNRYIFGAEPNPLHIYIKEFHDNFDAFISKEWKKSYSKGSTYKCSSDCDYIYVISKCGAPMQIFECPFCHKNIGGTNHKLIEREGHENLSHEQAYSFLSNAVRRHMSQIEAGLKFPGSLKREIRSIRGLNPISYIALHFVLGSIILALHQIGLIDNITLEGLIDSSILQEDSYQYLRESVKSDYEKLLEMSRSASSHLWVYKIISKLDELLLSCSTGSLSPKDRDEFEENFEQNLIIPNIDPQNSILEYSNFLKANYEVQVSFKDYIYEYINLKDDKNYPDIELFRIKGEPSLENLKNQYLLSNPEDCKIIDIYLKNSTEILKVESLYPIIKFTNCLLEIYNNKILRSEAIETTIKKAIEDNHFIKPLFENFIKAWNSKGIDNLQYECKVLDRIEFNEESQLTNFLVDNKVKGGGMYMAAVLIELAEIQNKCLSQINSIISNSLRDKNDLDEAKFKAYPLQKLKEENIISLDIDNTEILNLYSLSSPIYGRGKEIVYDFERIRKCLAKQLLLAKMIDTTKLDLIQYHLELLNLSSEESGLLLEIKGIINQKPLESDKLHCIELFFDELKQKGEAYQEKLKGIYGSFNYLLCYLRYYKGKNDSSIMNFCKELNSSRISEDLKGSTRISEIKLEYIISLYQIVEAKYFPYTRDFIKADFKKTDNDSAVESAIIELIKECDTNSGFYPTKYQVEDALMRFIIRNSMVDLNSDYSLRKYIVRNDFWDLNIEPSKIGNLKNIFSKVIKISHSLCAYDCLHAKNHKFIGAKLQPSVPISMNKNKILNQRKIKDLKRSRI